MPDLTLTQWGIVAGIGIPLVALLVRTWTAISHERKRTQPIVIVHEDAPPGTTQRTVLGSRYGTAVHAENAGYGSAFNVRFGIELRGRGRFRRPLVARYSYRMKDDDPASGNRQRVLVAGGRVPDSGSLEVRFPLDIAALGLGEGDLLGKRRYWALYENAEGKTWETVNPVDRTADLMIRRRRWLRLRQRWNAFRVSRAQARAERLAREAAT